MDSNSVIIASEAVENNIVDVISLFSAAIIGGVVAGGFTLWGIILSHKKEEDRKKQNHKAILQGFYQALHTEISTLWEIYQDGIGTYLENLKNNEPLLGYFPVTQDYFTIYKAHSKLIGQIPDFELRKLIVYTYTKAQGIVDSYRLNNHFNEQYESCHRIYDDTLDKASKEAHRQELERLYNSIKDYTKIIKESHNKLRGCVTKLLEALEKEFVSK